MSILLITVVVFLLVALVVMGIYYGSVAAQESTRSEVKRRLRTIALDQPSEEVMPSILKEEVLSDIPPLNRLLLRMSVSRDLDRLIGQADVDMRVGTLMLLTIVLFALAFIVGMFLHRGVIPALVIAVVAASFPYLYLLNRRGGRFRKFTEQFPDTLDMIARSLRAGHSFTSAMQVVSEEMPDPVAKVFRQAYDEQNLGLSQSEALANMTRRIESIDLGFFVTAVNIQRETGGNLSEILEKLGMTIRERFKILGQLKVYTAQGRLSGYILALMPIAMALILWVINKPYLMLLFTTKVGTYMLIAAVALQIIGFFIIRKIIHIQI